MYFYFSWQLGVKWFLFNDMVLMIKSFAWPVTLFFN